MVLRLVATSTRQDVTMMYRLGYDGNVTYCSLISLSDIPPEADLSLLDWVPSEVQIDAEYVQLALRDARATREGIVFPAVNWSARLSLGGVNDTYRTAVHSRQQRIAQADQIEQIAGFKGWGESQRRDEANLDEGQAHVVAKLRREIDQLLAKPIPADVRAACQSHGISVS